MHKFFFGLAVHCRWVCCQTLQTMVWQGLAVHYTWISVMYSEIPNLPTYAALDYTGRNRGHTSVVLHVRTFSIPWQQHHCLGWWHRVPAIWSCLILLGHFRAKYTRSLNSEFLGPTLEKSWDLTRFDLLRFSKVGWLLKMSTVWGGLPAVQSLWRSQTGDHELNPYH